MKSIYSKRNSLFDRYLPAPLVLSIKMSLSGMLAYLRASSWRMRLWRSQSGALRHLLLWIELLIDVSRCMQHPDNFYAVRHDEIKNDIAANRKTAKPRQEFVTRPTYTG